MIYIKTKEEIKKLREGGRRLAIILDKVAQKVVAGTNTKELDNYAEELIRQGGDIPAFLGYKSRKDHRPYPASLCVSVNNEVVHSLPDQNQILKEGDIVSLDLGLKHKGLYTDTAITVSVGEIDKQAKKLLEITRKALMIGIDSAKVGNSVGDIGYNIEKFVKPFGFGIIKVLAGHGVGKKVHEDPLIPNFGKKGTGEKLKLGMVIALEPMLNEGSDEVYIGEDGFTFKTKDGKRSAHFEHTILITESEAEILTKK